MIRFAIAISPIALYFLVIGMLRSSKSPVVLNGSIDFLLLGLGVSGLMTVGPMELFFPRAAYSVLGIWTWALLLVLYLFVLMLIALSLPPKLVVYGLSSQVLKKVICDLVEAEEIQADWLDSVISLPSYGIRGTIERANASDTVSHLIPNGRTQDFIGWHRFERSLAQQLRGHQAIGRTHAVGWFFFGIDLLILAGVLLMLDSERLVAGFTAFFE